MDSVIQPFEQPGPVFARESIALRDSIVSRDTVALRDREPELD